MKGRLRKSLGGREEDRRERRTDGKIEAETDVEKGSRMCSRNQFGEKCKAH